MRPEKNVQGESRTQELELPDDDAFVKERVVGLIEELEVARGRERELADENERLRGEVARLEKGAGEARARAEALAAEKAAAETQLAELRARFEKETAELEERVRRAEQLEAEVEKRRSRDRELRRLLEGAGSGGAKKKKRDPGDDPRDAEAVVAAPSPEAAGSAFASPPVAVTTVPAADEDVGVVEVEDLGGAPDDFDHFQRSLSPTTRLVPTDNLGGRSKGTQRDLLVRQLLEASPTYQTLLNQVHGKISEDRLRRILFELHGAGSVSLRG